MLTNSLRQATRTVRRTSAWKLYNSIFNVLRTAILPRSARSVAAYRIARAKKEL